MEGILHSIESLAAVDGDGLRCSIFLAGCPLRCAFCHNPDTWQMEGKRISSEDLVKKILRYRPYFGDNGGATFSGGEPLLQARFLREVCINLAENGVPFVLDTSGQVELSEDVLFLLKHAQSVLLDVKFWDDASYRNFTGRGIQRTLDTLQALDEMGTRCVIRTVIIPGINDTTQIMDRYLALLKPFRCVSKYELLPFHTMGFFKYEKLGIENPFAKKPACSKETVKNLQKYVDDIRKNG